MPTYMHSGPDRKSALTRREWIARSAIPAAGAVSNAQSPPAGLPFEKRVCRIYFDPMRPLYYDPVEKKQMPAALADIGITVNRGKLRRATAALTGRELAAGGNTVTVPVVRFGEVVRLELA